MVHHVRYFDMVTQDIFDICSHFKFVEAFNKAVIGPSTHAILLQYRGNTGEPSPGFRILLKTQPGGVYNVEVEGFLNQGNYALFFTESLNPRGQIICDDNRFNLNTKHTMSFNFRAVSQYTTLGMVFPCSHLSYCLSLTELRVCKLDQCLVKTSIGCTTGDNICDLGDCPPPDPMDNTITIDAPPKASEIHQERLLSPCPIKNPVDDSCESETLSHTQPDVQTLPVVHNKPVFHNQPVFHTQVERELPSFSESEEISVDYSGKAVHKLTNNKCSELGTVILEKSTQQLWICNGREYVQLNPSGASLTFFDEVENKIWEIYKN